MNNPAVHSYSDLLVEKARLKAQFHHQVQDIKNNFADIKHDLTPVGNLVHTVSTLTHRDKSLGFVSSGINAGLDWVLKKVVFRKAGWVTRLVAPFIVRNALSHFATKKVREN